MKHVLLGLLLLVPAPVYAQHTDHAAHAHPVLGTVKFENSGTAAAQSAFQRGVALLHSFEYDEAAEAFREAQRVDAGLALAYWLEALTYSHVLWGEENLSRSRAALSRLGATSAERLARAKTERERAFGAAVEAFYENTTLASRARAFAEASAQLAARYPDDHEAAVFAALSSMMAWYAAPASERDRYNAPVKRHALRVFRENPQHPGAAHYLIHFVDMNPHAAADALEFARAYDKIAPDAEHALHMPSHVYLPLGLWADVAAANERAWSAARRVALEAKLPAARSSWHSLEWLQYAYLQQGRVQEARALIDTAHTILQGATIADDDPDTRNVVNMLSFRYALETGQWNVYPGGLPAVDVVLKQPRPTMRAWVQTTNAAYQAAVAALRANHDTLPARAAVAAFLADASGSADNARRALPQRLAKQLEAMLAQERGDTDRAIALLREIAATEPSSASLPPTTIPSYELLGEYLLTAGRKAEAATAFQQALAVRANRASALRGLQRSGQP